MSTRGMRWAYLFGISLAFFLPKRVDCGRPGVQCNRPSSLGLVCHDYEVEPWGFYGLEQLLDKDVGFAYSRDEECS
jgi:hypothetical protein